MKEEGPSPSLLDTSHQPTRSGCCPARGGRCGTWLPHHFHRQSAKLGEAAASFSLHFSVLPNFNVKENVGHFKSIGRQLFLTQRIMGFSTMNCTSSGRINFDFFFSTRLYLHVAIFSLIQNKKCILLTLSSCVAASHELWHHKSKSSCFPGQSRTWFVGVNEQNAILFLGGLGMGGWHIDLLLEESLSMEQEVQRLAFLLTSLKAIGNKSNWAGHRSHP